MGLTEPASRRVRTRFSVNRYDRLIRDGSSIAGSGRKSQAILAYRNFE